MNIYVSHLSWGTSSEGLGNLFAQFGEVASANVITDRETGRSRGFGFVEMPDDEQARKAMEQLNGTNFEGQTITVNEARPREERPSGGFGGNRGGGYGGGNRGAGQAKAVIFFIVVAAISIIQLQASRRKEVQQ